MRQLADQRVNSLGMSSPVDYGTKDYNPYTWDADMVYGCSADKYGHHPLNSDINITSKIGSDLSLSECPYGYFTRPGTGNNATVHPRTETQMVSCTGTSGHVTLSLFGVSTKRISASASSDELKAALEAVPTIGAVNITAADGNSADSFCTSRTSTWYIDFLGALGDLPSLVLEHASASLSVTISTMANGEGSVHECSSHGDCDRATGDCICWPFRASSDGFGNQGTKGDCGFNVVY
jgi:hypothetical protein